MSGLQIAFFIIGAVTLVAAVLTVTSRKIMHAALWLIVALGAVAGIFATLEAGFFAAIQIAIYIGAIAILIIFAVMLTRRAMEDAGPQLNSNWPAALIISAGVLSGLWLVLSNWRGFQTLPVILPPGGENIVALGKALVDLNSFVVPFEIASLLLIAALIGAIFVASEPKGK